MRLEPKSPHLHTSTVGYQNGQDDKAERERVPDRPRETLFDRKRVRRVRMRPSCPLLAKSTATATGPRTAADECCSRSSPVPGLVKPSRTKHSNQYNISNRRGTEFMCPALADCMVPHNPQIQRKLIRITKARRLVQHLICKWRQPLTSSQTILNINSIIGIEQRSGHWPRS